MLTAHRIANGRFNSEWFWKKQAANSNMGLVVDRGEIPVVEREDDSGHALSVSDDRYSDDKTNL